MNRLRLLVISHEFSLTGAPIALLNLVSRLPSAWDVSVASPKDGPLRAHFLARQIRAVVAPNLDTDINVASSLLASSDLVLANTLLSYMAIHAAHPMRKPSVWYIHEGHVANMLAQRHGAGISAAFPLASRVAVPSEFSRRFYSPARTEIDLLPYGIEYRDAPPRTRNHPLKILQLGSIESRKGPDVACAAMRLMRDADIDLEIVGAAIQPEFFRHLVSQCADLRHVHLCPAIDPSRAPQRIAAADVVVVPSRDEVTPMVILEAMAQRKPVVAAAVGGIPEMIVDGQTGFLFEPENAAQLAFLFAKLADDAAICEAVAAAGQQYVRSHRTLEQYRDRLLQILQQLMNVVSGA